MNLGEAITAAKLHLRRDIWFDGTDWRALANQAVMEFASNTHALERDFIVTLAEGILEYDLNNERIYRLTEDGTFVYQDPDTLEYSYSQVPRRMRQDLYSEIGYDWYSETGTPQYIYPISGFTMGVYPIPDEDTAGNTIIVHGNYYPEEITSVTPEGTTLPFESIDHPTLVLGIVAAAERIDKDLVISRDVQQAWQTGIIAARSRKMNRFSGASRMKTNGR